MMRPTVDELLRGISQTLDQEVLPEIDTPWLQRMASTIMMASEHLRGRWREELKALAEEQMDLQAVVRELYECMRELSPGNQEVNALLDAYRKHLRSSTNSDLLLRALAIVPEVEDETECYRQLLDKTILLADSSSTLRHNPTSDRLRVAINGYLQRQLRREAHLIGQTYTFTGPQPRPVAGKDS